MRHIVQALLLIPTLLLPTAPDRAVAQAKVDEQVVAPNEDGLIYYISPRSAHVIAVTQKGSRFVVTRDGVPGPQIDKLLNPGTSSWIMNFSPDGERYGYTAKVGQDWIAVVDGKEVYRQPIGTNDLINRGGGPHLRFSPNGKHWVLYYHNPDVQRPTDDPSWYMWDGVAGPKGADAVLAVSPDGERHAYIVANPANTNQKMLVVDGKPAGYSGFDPIFTADGTRLYTTRQVRPAQGPMVTEVLLDGRVVARAGNAKIHIPPTGNGALVLLGRFDQQRGREIWAIAAGNGIVPNSESMGLGPVWFSEDGKHYAVKSSSTGGVGLIVDGVRHREYTSVDSVRFTDTGKATYVAQTGTKWFVLTGDQESDVMLASMFVSPQTGKGGRIGYAGSTTSGQIIVVDDKATKIEGRFASVEEFKFSPDGTHSAVWIGAAGSPGGTVSVDGAPGAGTLQVDFGQMSANSPKRYLWSPDSRFTLHYGAAGTTWGNDYGFFMGNRYYSVGKQTRVEKPTFTPDGKHLFWLTLDGQREMMEVWLDGKKVYEFDSQGTRPLTGDGAGWVMGADGVLTFVIQTVDGFKRVRVTPGREHGVDAMLTKGKTINK
jgi:hypothetical protein